jgi:hypothetical protein
MVQMYGHIYVNGKCYLLKLFQEWVGEEEE